MPEPLSNAHTVTKLPAQDLERARAFYRLGGVRPGMALSLAGGHWRSAEGFTLA